MIESASRLAPLGPAEARALDAQYRPFAPFAEWSAVDPDLRDWDRARAKLEAARASADAEAVHTATRGAMQGAAADTGAIEGLYPHDRGFTLTVATEVAKWEVELARKDPETRLLLQDQLRAYELALDVATRAQPATEALIRRIHEELSTSQKTYDVYVSLNDELVMQKQPLPRGAYKKHPNHVRQADGSLHAYAPVEMTAPEMARLVQELSSEAFASAHPVFQAAYAHHALTAVHPFADGNGRTARALASVFLFRSVSIPLVIFYEQRKSYYDALAAADGGRVLPFVRFITERGVDTMELIADGVREGPQANLSRLAQLLTIEGGITYEELVDIGGALLDIVGGEIDEQLGALTLPRGVTSRQNKVSGPLGRDAPTGYREIRKEQRHLQVYFQSAAPSRSAWLRIRVLTAERADDNYPLAVEALFEDARGERREHLYMRLTDAYPSLSAVASARLRTWIRGVLGEATRILAEQVAIDLRGST